MKVRRVNGIGVHGGSRKACRTLAISIGVALLGSILAQAQNPFAPPPSRISPLEPRPFSLMPDNLPLPALDVLMPRVEEKAFPAIQFHVNAFRFKGNHVFTDEQLSKIVAPYADRTINAEDLESARLAITAAYVKSGYVNSGAVLEDQDLEGGVVTLTIVEGTLNEIEVRGNRWLRSSFIKRRVEHWAHPPLQVGRLQEGLLLLNEQPMVVKVNADLQPSGEPGQSRLVVNVTERFPFHAGFEFSNDRPASVGAEHLDLIASDQSLTGNGDALDVRLGLLNRSENGWESSFDNFAISYTLPLTSWDTTLRLAYRQNDYTVIEEPIAELGVDGRSNSYDITLRQPLYHTLKADFALSVTGSRRHSESFLGGQRFSFSPGAINGEENVSVLRLGQEWLYRSQQQVIALRSNFHLGVSTLDATINEAGPDGRFFAWLGQGQYVRRLDQRGTQVILRVDGQWTSDQLLSLEQLAIGGIDTVRGYRENELVRDKGIIGSVELRFPLWLNGAGKPIIQLAGFYDIGAGWNVDEPTPDPKTLRSAGAGLLFTLNDKINAEIYWAHRFTEIPIAGKKDLQDYGLSFRVSVLAF